MASGSRRKKMIEQTKAEKLLLLEIKTLIEEGRNKAVMAVYSALTLTYWQVGKRINQEVLHGERAEYGKRVVELLANELVLLYGKSFATRNLRRMMQFSEIFPDFEILSPLVSQLSWTHFTLLLPLQNNEARMFYAKQTIASKWSKRELQNQIERKAFERSEISNTKLSLAKVDHLQGNFKDPYFLDFLGLKDGYFLDLLLFHRKLKRLIAIELKIGQFKAAYKGQMELYLNWLDKYERQEDEQYPIGLILCAEVGTEQVELLNMQKDNITVAEYWTSLPPKKLLEEKLHNALIEVKERLAEQKFLEEKNHDGI